VVFKKKIVMKIFILGSNGMLGRYVSKYLSTNYEVINLTRNEIDASSINYEDLLEKLTNLGLKSGDLVINCIGAIKQRVEIEDLDFIKINSIFPRLLANVCQSINCKMIHPTTDCVYSGKEGLYNEESSFDVGDVYGMSKALGEPKNCTVIRTSIIGEEIYNKKSLVEWIKSNKGGKTNGYLNHYWNGVTCLQFGKIVGTMIEKDLFWSGVKHLHSNKVDKYELSLMINKHFDLGITITPVEVPVSVDRSITTIHEDNLKQFNIPDLDTQIKEMFEFHNTLIK